MKKTALWLRHLPENPGPFHPWLIHQGSLTRKIESRCRAYAVKNVQQRYDKANLDEIFSMSLPANAMVLLREVNLFCEDIPLVFAHSVLPLRSLQGEWHGLRNLGNKPLGRALFADPRVQRTPLEYKKLRSPHALYRNASRILSTAPEHLWARRSIFSLGQKKIMVTEVFLPGILAL